MTHVPYDDTLLKNLNGKIAIITGSTPLVKVLTPAQVGLKVLAQRPSKFSSTRELKSYLRM